MSTPRIAFLNEDLWLGGGTTFVFNLSGELVRRRVPLLVSSLSHIDSLASDFVRLCIPVAKERQPFRIFEDRLRSVLESLAMFKPNAALVNMTPITGEILRYLPEGVRKVGIVHTRCQNNFDNIVRYAAFMNLVVTVSREAKEELKQAFDGAGVSAPTIICIEPGVPLPGAEFQKRGDPSNPLRILYLGRLEDGAKRVRLFPQILRDLEASGIAFAWTIAGEGPERLWLESQMRPRRENQKVHFTGTVPYSRVGSLLAEHDILLLTSSTESFPLSLHEAMAWGLVPVVSDLPGRIRELVTPKTGIRVDPDDVTGYAASIVRLHGDRGAMAEMSKAASLVIAKEHSVSAMADRWMAAIEDLGPFGELDWPCRFEVKAPLFAHRSVLFMTPARWARRLAACARRALRKE